MAGLGVFLPSETAYKDPGRFRDVLEAEGTKQARYLSSMDQFYAQMEESKRQFDVTSQQRERFFEEEMAFRGEELESEVELKRWLKREDVRLGERGIRGQERLGAEELGLGYERLGFEREKFGEEVEESEFLRGLYRDIYGGEGEELGLGAKPGGASGEDYLGPVEFWNF